jgi:RNA polymerase sigma-70 factor, ECF subfamily
MVAFVDEGTAEQGLLRLTGNRRTDVPDMTSRAAATAVDQGTDGFTEFYAVGFPALATQLYAYTGDLCLAQDLVQEAFCRAFSRWSRLSGYDDPIGWVRRVAFNLAKSRWQRAKVSMRYLRTQQREQYVTGPGPDRIALVAALAELPAAQRRAMVLHYLADQSVAQIAEQENVAEGTVKSWLHRGRAAMATLMSEQEVDHV